MSNTEQVAKLEARLGQLELLSAQRHSELKETLAQQDIQLEERFNQLALRLEERIAQIDSRCEVRMAQMVNAISAKRHRRLGRSKLTKRVTFDDSRLVTIILIE